jgi:hypothetical protein
LKFFKLSFIFLFIILFNSVFASNLMALHGKAMDSGTLITSGDLRVLIYDSASSGNLIYDSGTDFDNSISNGIFDVMLGSITSLDLNYGQNYWLDL